MCPFFYDVIVNISSDMGVYKALNALNMNITFEKKNLLSVTYNHRFFDIHDKNFIKALIDHFDIDHLMFSLRPSASQLIQKSKSLQLEKFKYFSQVIFVLQSMARYDIQKAIISKKYFAHLSGNEVGIDLLVSTGLNYLDDFEQKLTEEYPEQNIKKVFCSIFSLRKMVSKLTDKQIYFEDYLFTGDSLSFDQFEYKNQISELEKDIFFVGFDPNFKEVPWDKEYPTTKWTSLNFDKSYGEPIYGDKIQYCTRCCMPETMEGITFDEFGICTPCRSSEEKMHISWDERKEVLAKLLNDLRSDDYYDCMLPMSGGKDSTFQAYILAHRYKISALAVTHGANWMSLSGRYNLENCLQKFDLDHIIFHSKRSTIDKAARKALTNIGDACWHCHIGAGTFVIQTALNWNLELMIWGESISESDGQAAYDEPIKVIAQANYQDEKFSIYRKVVQKENLNDLCIKFNWPKFAYPSNV